MASSVLKGIFREYQLVFPSFTSIQGEPDEYGNPTWVLGIPTVITVTLKGRASGYGLDPVIRPQPGADQFLATFTGRCVDPVPMPPISPGSKSPLVINGVNGTFTLELTLPAPLEEVETQLGTRFIGSWTAS